MGQTNSSLRSLRIFPPTTDAPVTKPFSNRRTESLSAGAVGDGSMPPPPRLPYSANGIVNGPRSASPVPSLSGRKSPFGHPPRSATVPLPPRPPSIDLPLPQDSAFPRFPTSRPQSPAPKTPIQMNFPPSAMMEGQKAEIINPSMSPYSDGGEKLLKRMDSISPGPFHVKGDRENQKARHHRRSSSMTSSRDFIRPTSAGSTKARSRRPSTSSSVYTRNASVSSISGTARLTRDESDIPAVPSVPSTLDGSSYAPSIGSTDPGSPMKNLFDFGALDNRDSTTSHTPSESSQRPSEPDQKLDSKPSEPRGATHKAQASVATIMPPLHEIGSTSSFKPSKSLRGRRVGATSIDTQKANMPRERSSADEKDPDQVPPLPSVSIAGSYEIGNPYHTPHESVSSDGSSSSGVKSGSSRSSPPLRDSPQPSKSEMSGTHVNDGFQDFQFGVTEEPEQIEQPKQEEVASSQPPPVPPMSPLRMEAPLESPIQGYGPLDPPPTRFASRPATPSSSRGEPSAAASPHSETPFPQSPGPYGFRAERDFDVHESSSANPSRHHAPPLLQVPSNSDLVASQPSPVHSHTNSSPRLEVSPPRSPQAPAFVRPQARVVQPGQPLQRQNSSPLTSPDEYVVSSFPSQAGSNNLRLTPQFPAPPPIPDSSTSPVRRPTPPNKGPCRRCNETIIGKSVSSADGQLTGRYHKHCFVCSTCASPFQTQDCYVSNNKPYCARHYHELNNSICGSCDRGIEGPYLEMTSDPHPVHLPVTGEQQPRKFHPHCFTCQDCHLILREDYYEWNGRVLCEAHAFAATQRSTPPSSGFLPSPLGPGLAPGLGPGRRHYPEKRSTRLMMMM